MRHHPPAPEITALPTTTALSIGLADGAHRLPELLGNFRPNMTLSFPSTSDSALLHDLDNSLVDAILIHHLPAARDDLWFNPVALDALVVIVHPESSVQAITMNDLRTLFAGGDARMQPVVLEPGSGGRVLFDRMVMGEQRVSINAEIRPNTQSVVDAVSNNKAAIGYVTVGSLAASAPVRILPIGNIVATPTTLGTQEYPLTVPLYWVSQAEPAGELRGILGYLQSMEGQEKLGAVFGRIK